MKTLIRFAVAGAMLASFATAQAQNLPDTGNADLWLFVADPTAQTTFAEDTGITLSSLMPTGKLVAGATLSTAITPSFSLAANSGLSSYLGAASTAGHTLEWGVLGVQFPGTTSGTGYKKPGNFVSVFDDLNSVGGNIAQALVQPTLQSIGNGFEQDAIYLKSTYTAGGKVYAWSAGSGAGNVWGAATGGTGGSTDLYQQEFDQANIGLGKTNTLYGLTGNSSPGQVQSYLLGTNLTLGTNGTLSVGGTTPPPPVPLPAAVWLFGSGLLGLFGVGRRRAAAV
jgi:hypothetical protein